MDQVTIPTQWRKRDAVHPWVNDWIMDPEYAYFGGAHEGYDRLEHPVPSSIRKIFYLRDSYWIMIDRFLPGDEAEHTYDLHFHIMPDAELRENRLVTTGADGNLLIAPVEGACGEGLLEACPHPHPDHENPNHLVYRRKLSGPFTFVTLLAPFTGNDVPALDVELLPVTCDERILEPHEATALQIRFLGEEHTYFDQHMEWNLPWQVGGCAGTGRLHHSRVHGE
jgi:hypothetical protein